MLLWNSLLGASRKQINFMSSLDNSKAFICQQIRDWVSSTVLSSIRAHLPEGTSLPMAPAFLGGLTLDLGKPIPRGLDVWIFTLPSIYSDNFFSELEKLLTQLHTNSEEQFSIILQPKLSNGQRRTLGHSFTTNIQPKMDTLINWLTPIIENFQAQSASGEGIFTDSTLVQIRNVTDLPEPQATPISSSPANVKAIKDIKDNIKRDADKQRKRAASSSIQAKTLEAVNNLKTSMTTKLDQVVSAIHSIPATQPAFL